MSSSSFIVSVLFIGAVTAGCCGDGGAGGGGAGGIDTGGGDTGGGDTGGGGADACAGIVCAASGPCHVAGACDPATGLCSDPVAEDGTACDDGDACTQTDTCESGACVGSDPVTCTAEACQVAGTCDPATGLCSDPTTAEDATPCECGTCLGGVCSAVTIGSTVIGISGRPVSIDVDGDQLYFANLDSSVVGHDSVGSLPEGGGMPKAIAEELTNASNVVVSGANVYFADGSNNVWTAPKDGSAPATVLVPAGADGHRFLATDDVNLYWFGTGSGVVSSLPLAGGEPKSIAVDQPGSSRIVTDGTNVYWTNTTDQSVKQVAIGGGPITTLASNQQGVANIAVDATSVYWTDFQGGTVMKVPIGGGTVTTIASGQNAPNAITVAGTMVYRTNFGNGFDGTVAMAPIDGGAVTTLPGATIEHGAIAMTHDAQCVYWANNIASSIRSAPLH